MSCIVPWNVLCHIHDLHHALVTHVVITHAEVSCCHAWTVACNAVDWDLSLCIKMQASLRTGLLPVTSHSVKLKFLNYSEIGDLIELCCFSAGNWPFHFLPQHRSTVEFGSANSTVHSCRAVWTSVEHVSSVIYMHA